MKHDNEWWIVNNESGIIHARILNPEVTMNETSNANGYGTHCKIRSIKNFNVICIGFEKLKISFKTNFVIELEGKNSILLGEWQYEEGW